MTVIVASTFIFTFAYILIISLFNYLVPSSFLYWMEIATPLVDIVDILTPAIDHFRNLTKADTYNFRIISHIHAMILLLSVIGGVCLLPSLAIGINKLSLERITQVRKNGLIASVAAFLFPIFFGYLMLAGAFTSRLLDGLNILSFLLLSFFYPLIIFSFVFVAVFFFHITNYRIKQIADRFK